jgi:hypothetical protein
VVDPNEADLRPPPRDERDLVIAATNGRVIALENLSVIQPWLSDALCRIATGAGFGTRELFSDADEVIFSVQAPILLNGIVEVVISGDLQDRSIVQTLPTIDGYVSEAELWAEYERARPRILGALLDAVSEALAVESEVRLDDPPRMADFARWTVAASSALGWDDDELLDAYAVNRARANEVTLEASMLTAPVRRLAANGGYDGSPTGLLEELNGIVGESAARAKHWPKAPHVLSGELRRLAPSLRRGDPPVAIEFDRVGHEGNRVIRVYAMAGTRKQASAASAASAADGADAADAPLQTPHIGEGWSG